MALQKNYLCENCTCNMEFEGVSITLNCEPELVCLGSNMNQY